MGLQEITAYARERLGMDIQSANRTQVRLKAGHALGVWSLLTEYGYFYVVEGGGNVEIFRVIKPSARHPTPSDCASSSEAVQRVPGAPPASG